MSADGMWYYKDFHPPLDCQLPLQTRHPPLHMNNLNLQVHFTLSKEKPETATDFHWI
jgi:hypothetical protein